MKKFLRHTAAAAGNSIFIASTGAHSLQSSKLESLKCLVPFLFVVYVLFIGLQFIVSV